MAKMDLEAAMGHRRPRKALDADVAETVFGEMATPATEGAKEISVGRIKPSPFQRRIGLDQEYLDSLKQTILDGGLVTPITVRSSDSDTYELIAGHHRVEAFRQLDMGLIPAYVRRMTDVEAARALTVDNAVHRQLTDYERYKHIVMLRETGACKTVSDLAEVLGCSRAQIYNYEAFGALPPAAQQLLEVVGGEVLGATLAYELRELSTTHPEAVTEAIRRLSAGELRQAGALLWIKNKIAGPAKSTRTVVKMRTADKREFRLTIKDGEVRLVGEGLDAEKIEALLRENLEQLVVLN
ncbi:MAG TPA: ParB/RepB/Spo0J family partition protein [Aromatoleum sp.]|uniref:ParB/RepB/Spo0J family partition protein n=1 Tax=Aromatoleum sp. TaxID=2307007 RepID=UPI002B49ECE6|nr:ParB/RepB/Spo0J family partition protein [Aromatoleum sp.]HJV26009.1 ParB/RepB/Spo0J family partition protein [Aromatoleum sp.]